MMFSDWNLLCSLDIALPRVHAAFIKREMLIRSQEKTILRYWVPLGRFRISNLGH
jgi:hypothetical protein